MKKYNLSRIMKRAWELVKKIGMTISSGLKQSWREEKAMEITQEKLFKREQEINARKKELVKILRESDEWSVRRPSPEVAAEQEELKKELDEIKKARRNLPTLTFYVANAETRKIEKITVDNGKHHYSAEVRAIAQMMGCTDDAALGYLQVGKVESFETEKQAKNYVEKKNRKITCADVAPWYEEARRIDRAIEECERYAEI